MLGDLAAKRGEPYAGPPLAELPGLSPEEQAAVRAELERIVSAPPA